MRPRTPQIDRPYLFLSFDGVLHAPRTNCPLFFHVPALEEVLRKHPVRLIISSTWRHTHSVDDLRRRFSMDIGAMIQGITPDTRRQYDRDWRYHEIQDYLRQQNDLHASWVALDAWQYGFPASCPNLLLCGPHGFSPWNAQDLASRLAGFVNIHPSQIA